MTDPLTDLTALAPADLIAELRRIGAALREGTATLDDVWMYAAVVREIETRLKRMEAP